MKKRKLEVWVVILTVVIALLTAGTSIFAYFDNKCQSEILFLQAKTPDLIFRTEQARDLLLETIFNSNHFEDGQNFEMFKDKINISFTELQSKVSSHTEKVESKINTCPKFNKSLLILFTLQGLLASISLFLSVLILRKTR